MTTLNYYTLPLGSVGLFVLYSEDFILTHREEIKSDHYNGSGRLIYFFNSRSHLQVTMDHKSLDLQVSSYKRIKPILESITFEEPVFVLYRLTTKGHESEFFTFKVLKKDELNKIHALFEKRDVKKLRGILTREKHQLSIPHPHDFLQDQYGQSKETVDTPVDTFPTNTNSNSNSTTDSRSVNASITRNTASSDGTINSGSSLVKPCSESSQNASNSIANNASETNNNADGLNIETVDMRDL